LCGDPLDRAPQLDLGLEQLLPRAAVLAGLAGETDVGIGRQGAWSLFIPTGSPQPRKDWNSPSGAGSAGEKRLELV
jgi:hypothetical protein